jgi:hypothetical protein
MAFSRVFPMFNEQNYNCTTIGNEEINRSSKAENIFISLVSGSSAQKNPQYQNHMYRRKGFDHILCLQDYKTL